MLIREQQWEPDIPVAVPVRILIADDHAVVRSGLRHLLHNEPDLSRMPVVLVPMRVT
jgi:CheY-like chemotaxis protein